MSKIELKLIDSMGTDVTSVANAARVSFGKTAAEYSCEDNVKLVKYLAKNNHWTPMCSLQLSVSVKLPLQIHAQLVKHQIGGVINTQSRRYVRGELEFFEPVFREAPGKNVKQGSGKEIEKAANIKDIHTRAIGQAQGFYEQLLSEGVCAEQARGVLPVDLMTSCIVVGSLPYFARIYKQRTDPHAQKEWLIFCEQLSDICTELFPVTWVFLIGGADGQS